MTADLQALLARVESGTGEDRELDEAIGAAIGCYSLTGDYGEPMIAGLGDRYTASLDAAVALVERARPGWSRRVYWERSGLDGHKWAAAELFDDPPPDGEESLRQSFWARAKTETRAIIAALIRAEIAKMDDTP